MSKTCCHLANGSATIKYSCRLEMTRQKHMVDCWRRLVVNSIQLESTHVVNTLLWIVVTTRNETILYLYLFSFDICSGMCLSRKPINVLINKVYASYGHSLFTKSSQFVVNRELLKLSLFDLLKIL